MATLNTSWSARRRFPWLNWPICIWLAQLPVPIVLLAYAAVRVVHGPPLGIRMELAAGLCAAWAVAVLSTVFSHRFRAVLVVYRHQLALCCCSVLCAVAMADIALTLTGAVPTLEALRARSLEYRPSVATRHRLVPKTITLDGREQIRINRRGYLGSEIAVAKPHGAVRIVFLGESQMFGTFWSEGENWPATVGEILSGRGMRVDCINAAVPGHQSADSLGKLTTDLWMIDPDILVVCHAWNDIKYFCELTPDFPYCDAATPWTGVDPRLHPRGIDRLLCLSALYRMGHGNLITLLYGAGDEGEKLREPNGRMTPSALRQYRLNLQSICDVARNIGAKVVLCKQARLPVPNSSEADRRRISYEYTGLGHEELLRAFAACDRAVDEVAAEKGCYVIDMNGPLSGMSDLFADHIHFNRTGSRRAAALVARDLERLSRTALANPGQ